LLTCALGTALVLNFDQFLAIIEQEKKKICVPYWPWLSLVRAEVNLIGIGNTLNLSRRLVTCW
jgi:hypothetical protein